MGVIRTMIQIIICIGDVELMSAERDVELMSRRRLTCPDKIDASYRYCTSRTGRYDN